MLANRTGEGFAPRLPRCRNQRKTHTVVELSFRKPRSGYSVNRHTRESHIQRSFRTHCGTERQLGGTAAGPARSSCRKSTLLAVPSLLDEKELHDEKEFLQQMRAGPLDRRFPLFVGLRCMLFHTRTEPEVEFLPADRGFSYLTRILDSLKVRQKGGGRGVIWVRQAN